MKKKVVFLIMAVILSLGICACGADDKMQDGFYTAEMADYSHGWKEYVSIMVKEGKIVSVEFNAKDPSGYIKAWDNAYMNSMLTVNGTYPNEYTRYYAAELIEKQDASDIDALTGASSSGGNFVRLSAAVIEQAIQGDSNTVIVKTLTE